MKIGIFGAGGFGREVLPEVRFSYPSANIVFVADNVDGKTKQVNGCELLTLDEAIQDNIAMVLAVGDWLTRKRVYENLKNKNIEVLNIKARSSIVYDRVKIGKAAVICSNSIITSNVVIGIGFQCNLFSYVAHDCIVGDYVTLAPRVSCNGNVIIEDGAYIGTGAVLRQGSKDNPLVIGREAIVGMGAVVTKNVPPKCTVIGNPARIHDKSKT